MLEVFTLTAVLGGIGNCLLGAVGGRAVDGLEKLGGRQIARYTAHWSLPENEHVARALRSAQFDALSSFIDDFERWTQRNPQSALDGEAAGFLAKARRFAAQGRNAARTLPDAAAKEVASKFEATLDKVLAGKTGTDERARVLVMAAEQTVLGELRRGAGLAEIKAMPQLFVDAFRGRYEALQGWHARFVHYWQDAIKHNEDFRSIFTAERLARIAEGIEEIRQSVGGLHEKADAQATAAERRHAEMMDAVIRNTGLPALLLEPIFQAVELEFTQSDIAAKVEEAVARIRELAQRPVDVGNLGQDIAALIEAARNKLAANPDVGAAVAGFAKVYDDAESRMLQAARLAEEEARMYAAVYRFDDAIAAFRKAARFNPDDAWHCFDVGDIRRTRGNLAMALREYEAGKAVAERTGNDRDLSVSHNRIGNVLVAQGDLGGALAAYEAGLAIKKKLASGDASNSLWQRDLSVSHNKIGDVLVAQGELGGALAAYEAGHVIAQKLASVDASNSLWQRDISVSHNKIGDVLRAQGDLGGALEAYEAGLAIRKKLASGDASNSQWQRDLSVSHEKIGDVLVAQGDLGGALAAYEAGLAIAQKLASADPSNSEWQRDLIVSHFKLSEAGGDPVKHLEQALAIANRLKAEGRLAPVDAFIPGMLEEALKAARGG